MALINCPECGEKISDKSSACPHCGFKLHKDPPKPVKLGFLGGIALIYVIYKVSSFFSGAPETPPASPEERKAAQEELNANREEIAAYDRVQDLVKAHLYLPHTASFPSLLWGAVEVKKNNHIFLFTTYVDHKNVFNAPIRSKFRAKVRCLGPFKEKFDAEAVLWKVLDFKFLN